MIQAGDLIDSTIGVTFGFATLTAAAFGQVGVSRTRALSPSQSEPGRCSWTSHARTHARTHPLTHSPTHPLTHSLAHSLTRSLARSLRRQVFSDVSGVLCGGSVDALATRLGLPRAQLSAAQLGLRSVKLRGTLGQVRARRKAHSP